LKRTINFNRIPREFLLEFQVKSDNTIATVFYNLDIGQYCHAPIKGRTIITAKDALAKYPHSNRENRPSDAKLMSSYQKELKHGCKIKTFEEYKAKRVEKDARAPVFRLQPYTPDDKLKAAIDAIKVEEPVTTHEFAQFSKLVVTYTEIVVIHPLYALRKDPIPTPAHHFVITSGDKTERGVTFEEAKEIVGLNRGISTLNLSNEISASPPPT